MDEQRVEMLKKVYGACDEDARLQKSRQGQLEFVTTMHHIHQFARPGCRVLEIGAGTGRYAIALAKLGYAVSAVELVQSNLDILRGKAEGLENLDACQGDALDLGRFQDASFDLTLLLGPMYHLYSPEDQHRALDEALRVTRPGGILMAAFLSVHAIMYTNYLYGDPPLGFGLKENFDAGYKARHFTEQLFTGFDVPEFEALFEGKPIRRLATVATDGILELAERSAEFSMTDEEFRAFSAYHLEVCARRELLGGSSHLLYIGRKEESLCRE